ncbi:MAG: ATP-dependent zinc metalloprotease FtsH [Pseudomonadota bacterium]
MAVKKTNESSYAWVAFALLIAALLLFFYSQRGAIGLQTIAYSEFKQLVQRGEVAEVVLKEHEISGRLHRPQPLGEKAVAAERFTTEIPAIGDDQLLPLLDQQEVKVSAVPGPGRNLWLPVLLAMLPLLLVIGFFYWAFRQASRNITGGLGGRSDLRQFLGTPAKEAKIPKVRFSDVAGQENAKREVSELVDYLRTPDQYTRLGAEVPRGVLLMGAPGTGKTLLAKALAGEAGVPFFSISGSEFIEVFVGVGASRVRSLFNAAKERAPSIVFIDELDSIGRTRGTGLGGGHDEREQTLNQILAEMDGFTGREAVVVLAATNRPDVLDPALLRPGRFDRHVMLDLPDKKDREAILQVHTRKVPLGDDVDMGKIAAGTPGFSGADIKNLVNEAAMLAAREKQDKVAMHHFDEARDKLLLGTVRTLAMQPDERHRLAVHESGHTLAAFFLPHSDPLYKVTIIPRGHALGGTQQLPEHERHTLPKEYLCDRLVVILAGRAAESELLGSVSSGADDDIRQATVLARAMVARWGMSDEIGPMDLRESEEHPFLGREIAQPRRFSESSAQAVDQAVRRLLLDSEQRALDVIRTHAQALERLIALLEERESLEKADIEACLKTDEMHTTTGRSVTQH